MIKSLVQRTVVAASGLALLGASAIPALADNTITITGNGADSSNTVNVTSNSNNSVSQSNSAAVINLVSTSGNTGGNKASNNTGGDVTIDTGNAKSDVTLSTIANTNDASPNCGCPTGDNTIKIKDNGKDSTNDVTVKSNKKAPVEQRNRALVVNGVKTKGKTGKNKANGNTAGTVDITTGNTNSTVEATTDVNHNTLMAPPAP